METQPIVITRVLNAKPEEVWKSWMEPEQIKKWWGPTHYTAPIIKNDPKVGGKYLFAMKSPEGQLFWSTGTYKEISPNKIVATDSFSDEKGNIVPASTYGMDGIPDELMLTVSFEKQGENQTKLTIKHEGFPPGEMRDMCIEGWSGSLDKLYDIFPSDTSKEAPL